MLPPASACRLGSNREDTESRNRAQQGKAGTCEHSPDSGAGDGRNVCRRPERSSISPSSPNCWLKRWLLAARELQFPEALTRPRLQTGACILPVSRLSVNDRHAPPVESAKEPNGLACRDINATAAPPQTGGLAAARQKVSSDHTARNDYCVEAGRIMQDLTRDQLPMTSRCGVLTSGELAVCQDA